MAKRRRTERVGLHASAVEPKWASVTAGLRARVACCDMLHTYLQKVQVMQHVGSLPCKCRCWRRRKRQPRLEKKNGKSWTACQPRDDEAKTEFKRAVLQTKEGESQDCLEQDQKMIEEAVEEIPTVRKWNQTGVPDNLRRRWKPWKERQPETPEQLKDGASPTGR